MTARQLSSGCDGKLASRHIDSAVLRFITDGMDIEKWQRSIARGMAMTPFMQALDGEMSIASPGRSRIRIPYSDKLIGNPDTGVVHGGVITAMLDQACGMAIGSALRAPAPFATLDLRIDYMKPARPGADLICEAECLKIGHEVAFARARAFQDMLDDPIAIATGTFSFTPGKPMPGVG